MIFEKDVNKKIAGVDVDLIQDNGFNVVISPKVLRSNRNRAVPTIDKNGIEIERVIVIVFGVVCLLLPFILS